MNNLDDRIFAAEKLIRKRTRRGKTEYFVKWRGWGPRYNTWEPESNILDARLIDVYEQNQCKVDHSGRRGNKRKSHQIIRNDPIESDHDDSVNGGGANSHDESETGKIISENADALNDEDDVDLPDDGESKENGVDVRKRKNESKILVSDGESTSSEDTLPLSKRKENSNLKRKENSIGMKRKAEVLSKESGKIGVTITTSPPNGTKHPKSSSPKDVKPSPNVETTNKLYIRKSPATSPRGGGETPVQYQCVSKLSTSKGDTNSKGNLLMTCKTENTISAVAKDDNKSTKESKSNTDKKKIEINEKTEGKTQISIINDSNNNNKDKDKKNCNNIEQHSNKDKINNENINSNNNDNINSNNNKNSNTNKDRAENNIDVKVKEQNKKIEIHNENNIDAKKGTITNGEVNDTSKLENVVANKKNDKNVISKEKDKNKEEKKSVIVTTVLKNPGHEYWRLRSPAADKIFITDVTVDLNTVTIRECKTDHGFFRQRDKEEENVETKDSEKSTR